MEFTKDDYVVEGNLDVVIEFTDRAPMNGLTDRVTIKSNWIIIEGPPGTVLINRETIRTVNINFKES